jgi:hypothetical protein
MIRFLGKGNKKHNLWRVQYILSNPFTESIW